MALFGVERAEPPLAARQALAAARAMALALDRLNRELKGELVEPLRMAIDLHAGPVIVGEMGDGRARSLTAIGDAVNVASRLEALSKAEDAQLVVSEELAALAGTNLSAFERREIEARGRRQRLAVRIVPDARRLPAINAIQAVAAATSPRRAWAGLLLLVRQASVKRPAWRSRSFTPGPLRRPAPPVAAARAVRRRRAGATARRGRRAPGAAPAPGPGSRSRRPRSRAGGR